MTTITYAAPTPASTRAAVLRDSTTRFDVYTDGACMYRDRWDDEDGNVYVGRWKHGEYGELVAEGLTFEEVARFLRVTPLPEGKSDEDFTWYVDGFTVAIAGTRGTRWGRSHYNYVDTEVFTGDADPEALPFEEFTYLEGWYRPRLGIA